MTLDKSQIAAYEEAMLVYDRYGVNVSDDRRSQVHIFGSSSKGNSVYLTKIRTLIDLGLPMKRYTMVDSNFFTKVDYIILTHEHADHVNISTLTNVLKNHPHVTVIIHPNMWQALIGEPLRKRVSEKQLASILAANGNTLDLNRFVNYSHNCAQFVSAEYPLLLRTREHLPFVFTPHVVTHGPIKNLAIELYYLTTRILYASDLDTVLPIQDSDKHTLGLPTNHSFDIVCLEANYDEQLLAKHLAEYPGDAHAMSNLRHISEQAAQTYVANHLHSDGIYIPLHASRSFGTYFQKALGNYIESDGATHGS